MAVIGQAELMATMNTAQYKKGAAEVKQANKDMDDSGDKTSKSLNSGFSSVAKVGMAALATAAVAAGAIIVSSIGGAIKRVDTLNNSARTFENMGFATETVSGAMKNLEASIKGMPTPLDAAVRGMQSLSATYGDVESGQKVFSALNNAIIGFGGTASEVDNAVQQLSQLPMDGPLDAQTWNSLRNSGLTPVLVAIAKDMGLGINEMKEKFGEGELTVRDFTNALTRMDKDGGGGMKSLQQIAKDATSGIGTGWENMKTAVTRGIAEIIKAVGSEKISKALGDIGKTFEGALKSIAGGIASIASNEALLYGFAAVIGTVLVAAFAALAVAIWTALAPVLPFALAIAAVGAAAFLIKKNWDKIQDFIQPAIDAFKKLWEIIKPFRDFVGEQLTNAWNDLRQAFEDVKTALSPFMPQIITLAKVIGIGLLVALGIVVGLFVAVAAAIVLVVVAVARLIGWMVKASATIIEFGISVVKVFVDAYQAVYNFTMSVWNAVVNTFNGIIGFFREWGLTILAVILAPFSLALGFFYKFKDQIISIFNVAWATIVQIFTPVVEFFTSIFTAAYNATIAVWQPIGGWFGARWNEVMNIYSGVADFFATVFSRAWENVKSIFNGVYGYFRGIYDSIVGIFSPIGVAIGNAIGGAFKSVINGIIREAVNYTNGFIDALNSAIGVINNIPGVKVPNIGRLGVPQLAEGGIVSKPTLAMIGEGGESEAVIPLSKLDKLISGGSGNSGPLIEVNIGTVAKEVDLDRVMDRVVKKLSEQQAIEASGVAT